MEIRPVICLTRSPTAPRGGRARIRCGRDGGERGKRGEGRVGRSTGDRGQCGHRRFVGLADGEARERRVGGREGGRRCRDRDRDDREDSSGRGGDGGSGGRGSVVGGSGGHRGDHGQREGCGQQGGHPGGTHECCFLSTWVRRDRLTHTVRSPSGRSHRRYAERRRVSSRPAVGSRELSPSPSPRCCGAPPARPSRTRPPAPARRVRRGTAGPGRSGCPRPARARSRRW